MTEGIDLGELFDEGSPRPAPEALDTFQEEVLGKLTETSADDEFVNWSTRADVLLWCQRVSGASLGRIDDGWASRVLSDSSTVAALLSSEARRREFANIDGDPLTHREAEFVRENVADTVEPAFRQALRDVSRWAGEYNEDGGGGSKPDPTSQRHLAMRPTLEHTTEQHRAVLQDGLEGFRTRRQIRRWAKRAVRVTDGILDDSFSRTARYSPLWYGALVGGEETRETRVQLLATRVFPYLNAAVRLVASEAGEAQDAEVEQSTVPTG